MPNNESKIDAAQAILQLLTNIDTKVNRIESKADELISEQHKQSEEILSLETRVNQVEAATASHSQMLEGHGTRLNGLELSRARNRGMIAVISAVVAALVSMFKDRFGELF